MLNQSLLHRAFSLFLLLALVLSIVGQNTAVSAAPDTPLPFLDDFTGGAPSGFVGFADSWDGSGSSTTLALTFPTDDLPTIPAKDDTEVASVAYNVAASGGWGGGPGYAGVSHDFASTLDLSGYNALRFWYKGGSTGAAMRIELKADGDNPGVSNRFEYGFVDDFSDWRYFAIPFSSFTKRTDYNPGAGLGDDLDLSKMWGYSILIPSGAAGTFLLDEVSVTGYAPLMADFTGGTPAGFVGFADSWDGSGSSTTLALTFPTDDLPTIPAQDDTQIVTVTYSIAASGGWGGGPGYGGVSHDYAEAQDWNNYQGLGFWYKGGSTGAAMRVELKTDGANPGASNRFEYGFADDFSDWKYFSIPWSSFVKRTDYNPGAGLGDDINFGTIWGYSILLPAGAAGSFSMDNIAAYGGGDSGGGPVVPVVRFNSASYIVNEDDGTATITVNLNTATTVEVTVDYATSDGTGVDGVDYTAASGTLTFDAGDTSKTFTVAIADNGTFDGQKTINLALADPVAATLGTPNVAVLTVVDDDAPDTRLVDDYTGSVAPLYNPFGTAIGFATWGSENGNVQLDNPTIADTDPLALPGQSGDISVLEVDYNIGAWGGFTHAFEDGNDWVSQDWSRYDGVSFWLYGNNTGGVIQTEIFDNQSLGSTGDSAERYYYRITDDYTGWRFFRIPFSAFQRRSDYQPGGAPNDGLNLTEVSGYAFGFPAKTAVAYLADYSLYGDLAANPLSVRVQSAAYAYGADEGDPITVKVWLNEAAASQVTVDYSITPGTSLAGINYTDTSGTLTFDVGETVKTVVVDTIDDGKVAATLNMTFTLSNPGNAVLGWKEWTTLGVFNTTVPDPSIIDDFEKGLPVPANLPANPNGSVVFDWEQILAASPDAVPGQFPINYVLSGEYDAGASFHRLFSLPRDLTDYNALRFWYKGSNSGEPVNVTLLDGQPDPGPSGWTLAWEDEFVGADGDSPNTTYWNFNIGGQGWGNNEWQYYTDNRDNSALDGSGNLVITAMPNTDPSLECAYGPGAGSPPACSYTSARLLTKDKIDFAYGRVEARIKIPYGQGVWPAFWMLGSDIDEVSWPQSGEIDILENIGKASEQSLLYGTIHGPGYSGGSGVGSGPHDTGATLHEDFHTYAIEWEPDEIRWYFDGVEYFSATPDDIPNGTEWVFDKPFFLILNVAVGGNWPGYPDETTTFPQHMTVDYVRVYQGPDNAQRFESTFVDDSSDWKLVTLPYSGFVSSATQPAGAASNTSPVLTHVNGYGFEFPNTDGAFKLDNVRGVDVAGPTIMFDYDGDKKSDPAKFYPSNGMLWWLASSTSGWESAWLGDDATELVTGSDYDGDAKSDPAKFVSSDTLWYLGSMTGLWQSAYLGDDGAVVGRSDFDGDGKTDPAKFVSSIGALWYIESSTGLWQGVYLGPDTFEYLAGNDFDGDGITDPAKYVPSVGVLWYNRSTDSTWQGVYLGVGDYDYISGNDYDGDGKSDPTVFYPGTGTVWWQNSSTGIWDGVWMGSGTFTFVGAHDFDGDGKTDLAKFDPVTGILSWLSSDDGEWYTFDLGTDGYDLAN